MSMDPRVICISGPDGVGKTTQAEILVSEFRSAGINAKYIWLRFSHVLILPLLALLKVMGRSGVTVQTDGTSIGFHDLRGSRLLREVFFAFTFADLLVAYSLRVTLPRTMGTRVVIDRNALDAVADISISSHDGLYWKSTSAQLLLTMATRNTTSFVLVCSEDELRRRRGDVRADPMLHEKLLVYSEIARHTDVHMIDVTGMSKDQVHSEIVRTLQGRMNP